jgi:hypothetical protein
LAQTDQPPLVVDYLPPDQQAPVYVQHGPFRAVPLDEGSDNSPALIDFDRDEASKNRLNLFLLSLLGVVAFVGIPLLVVVLNSSSDPKPKLAQQPAQPKFEPAKQNDPPRRPPVDWEGPVTPKPRFPAPESNAPIGSIPSPRDDVDIASKPSIPEKSVPLPGPPNTEPIPVPGELLKRQDIPGYQVRTINGFTMALSTQAIREANNENGKPFEALLTEFEGLVKVVPPKMLNDLRRVPIWIEWDNRENQNVLAKYYGGGGVIWRLDPRDPWRQIKANAVELVSLKSLAREKQYALHPTRLVLLHELAHAVHHVCLPNGFENPAVYLAYTQAMNRRLYDSVMTERGPKSRAYAATNAAEYFAELTCAYLDRCTYFPFTREDLKDYDDFGYRLMEQIWTAGQASPKPASKGRK